MRCGNGSTLEVEAQVAGGETLVIGAIEVLDAILLKQVIAVLRLDSLSQVVVNSVYFLNLGVFKSELYHVTWTQRRVVVEVMLITELEGCFGVSDGILHH